MIESKTTVSDLGYLSFFPRCIKHDIGHTDTKTRQHFERALVREAVEYFRQDASYNEVLRLCNENALGVNKAILPLALEDYIRSCLPTIGFEEVRDIITIFLSYGLLECRVPFKIMCYNGGKPSPYFYNFTVIATAVLSKFS